MVFQFPIRPRIHRDRFAIGTSSPPNGGYSLADPDTLCYRDFVSAWWRILTCGSRYSMLSGLCLRLVADPLLRFCSQYNCPLVLPTGTAYRYCPLVLPTGTAHWYCPLVLPTGTAYWYCRLNLQPYQVHYPVDECQRMGRVTRNIQIYLVIFNKFPIDCRAAGKQSPAYGIGPDKYDDFG